MLAVSAVWPWAVQSSMIGLPCCCPSGVTQSRTPSPAELTRKVYDSLKLAVKVPVQLADQVVGPTDAKPGAGEPPGYALPSDQVKSTRSSQRVNEGVPDMVGLLLYCPRNPSPDCPDWVLLIQPPPTEGTSRSSSSSRIGRVRRRDESLRPD